MKSNMNHYQCWYRPVCKNVDTVHCTDVCVSFYEMLHLLEQSGIPQNLFSKIDLVPDNSDIEAFKQLKYIKDNIHDFIKQGNSLYLWSHGTGNGKTSWSIKLLQSYFHAIHFGNGLKPRGFFIHTPSYLLDCKNRFSDKSGSDYRMLQVTDDFGKDLLTTTNILNVDVIVWDEIGSDRFTPYDYINLLSVIDQRCLRGKSNIFTSNYSIDELQEIIGDKIASRLNKNTSYIELTGSDRRGGFVPYVNG